MNLAETTLLLKARSGYTSQPYGQETIGQWHAALEDHPADQVQAALARAAKHTNRIALADVLGELRNASRPEQVNAKPAAKDCPCGTDGQLQRVICDHHRTVGLDAIARLRAQQAARRGGAA